MSKPTDNPHLDQAIFKEQLPLGHPANEEPILTALQSFAFPVLVWFFDQTRNRGTGRSYLLARVLIELAKRGHTVSVKDVSTVLLGHDHHRNDRHLLELVHGMVQTRFPNDLFEFRTSDMTMIYKGRRPR